MKKYQAKTKKKKALFTRALLTTAGALGYKNPKDEGVHELIQYAKTLIALKANVNAYYKYKCNCFAECGLRDTRPPLILAIDHLELVKALLLAGAQVNAHDTRKKETALIHATNAQRAAETVSLLINAGANIETRDRDGVTPLMRASGFCNSEDSLPASFSIVKLLLESGAHINKQDRQGKTALMKAARFRKNYPILETLLAARANQNIKDKNGKTALLHALSNPHLPTIKMLLAAGANINTHDREGYTVLLHATSDVALAQLFIDAGANVNAQTNSGKTALIINATYCNEQTCAKRIAMMELLLKAGADIKNPGYTKVTCIPMINALLAAGADIHAPDRKGDTALIQAAKEANAIPVQLLIDTGADLNAQARECKWTALMVAASSDNEKDSAVIRTAINASENDELYGDQYGTTAYHLFAQQALTDRALADLAILELLIKAGADLNKRGSHGETALIIAASRKHDAAGLIKVLLAAGADITLKDYKGKTARSYAARDVKPLFYKR